MPDLTGKVAIVTGSTKGIGLAIAEHLARAGASVVVSARSAADVETVAARLGAGAAGRVLGLPCDVRDPEACNRLVADTVAALGRLDILVNNAGLGIIKPIQELSVEEWRTQIDTNLGGVFYCSKAAIPHLSASGDGSIINIGSLASRNTFSGGTGYNASKFGLLGMTEAMMLDVRYDDVRVSILMPGSVNTAFNGREQAAARDWRLEADDCALAVMQLLAYPKAAHASRIEMRPSQPRKG
ncbi:MAG: SDR family oxidoreductase [Gemmatimonadetes bacterium]|nr:SDR family oxidoreductase [Gemmatimonadota bacterium]